MWFINGRCGFCVSGTGKLCVSTCLGFSVKLRGPTCACWIRALDDMIYGSLSTCTQKDAYQNTINLIRAIPLKIQTCQGLFRLPNGGKLSAWQGLKVSFMTCIGIVHRGMQDAETRTVSEHFKKRYVPGSVFNMWLTTVKYFWYASLEIFIVSHIFPLCGARVITLWEDLNFFNICILMTTYSVRPRYGSFCELNDQICLHVG